MFLHWTSIQVSTINQETLAFVSLNKIFNVTYLKRIMKIVCIEILIHFLEYQNQQDMNCYPNVISLNVDTNFNNEYGYFNTNQPQQNILGNLPQKNPQKKKRKTSKKSLSPNSSQSSDQSETENSQQRYIKWNVGLPKPVLPHYNDIKEQENVKIATVKLNETYSVIPLYSYEQWAIFKEAEKTGKVHCLYCNHDYDNQPSDVRDHLRSFEHARAVCYVYYQNDIKYPGCIDTTFDEKNISDTIFPMKHPKKLKTKEEKERYVQWLKDNHIINFYTRNGTVLTRFQLEK